MSSSRFGMHLDARTVLGCLRSNKEILFASSESDYDFHQTGFFLEAELLDQERRAESTTSRLGTQSPSTENQHVGQTCREALPHSDVGIRTHTDISDTVCSLSLVCLCIAYRA